METRIVIRDNTSDRAVELIARMDQDDTDFINEIGERIAHGTGYDVTVLAVEAGQ